MGLKMCKNKCKSSIEHSNGIELTEEFIRYIISVVMLQLSKGSYGIPKYVYYRMYQYIESCKVYFLHENSQETAKVVENLHVGPGGVISVRPDLYIVRTGDSVFLRSILFHELMHLLSIGDCTKGIGSTNCFFHCSGLDQYELYASGAVVCINQCDFFNEVLNDSLAHFLFSEIYNEEYLDNPRFACLDFFNSLKIQLNIKGITSNQLIGYYLCHNNRAISHLFGINDNSFLELNQEIYKCYRKNKKYKFN